MSHNLDKILSMIETSGIAILTVTDKPAFSYSIGAANIGLPDIFISGEIPQNAVVELINNVFSKMRRDGYSSGMLNEIATVPVQVLPCHKDISRLKSEFTLQAENVYQYTSDNKTLSNVTRNINPSSGVPDYVQMVFPDTQGRFPWDKGYDERFFQHLFCYPPQ